MQNPYEELINQALLENIPGIKIPPPSLKPQIQQGWRHIYAQLFGQDFVDVLAPHHIEAIEWHWESRIAFLEKRKPEYLAYFPIWARGSMKCVDANTEILMDNGSRKAIKDIQLGDLVQSYDEVTRRIVVKPVLNHWHSGVKECIRITTKTGQSLVSTPDHRIRTFDGWKKAGDITPNDRLAVPRQIHTPKEDAEMFWDGIKSIEDVGQRDTYDIEVADTHNFIADGIVTHNSTVAERMVVVDGVLSFAYKQHGYCVYISRNKDKVQEHIANIESLLGSEKVRAFCPQLSNPKRTEVTNQQRKWTSSFLKTEANYSIQGGTLDSGLAGSRVEDTRVTFLVPDDIDAREDSPVIAENRLRQFTREVLPMRQANTLVFFAQNLISRFSVMYRIHSNQVRVLTNRKPSQPIPAVYDLVTESRTVDGIVKDIYISGVPSWAAWTPDRIQDEIDTEGLESFKVEMQHEVTQSKEGLILHQYRDEVHVISESEFASVYGSLDSWLNWRKKAGNDWARTKTDKHANVAGWWTISSEYTDLPNHKFLFYPMSFPPDSAPEDVAERLLSVLNPYAYDKVTWEQLRKDILRRANADNYTSTVAEKIAFERQQIGRIMHKYASKLLQQCNVQAGEMSHEQDTVRKIYQSLYGLNLRPTNPKKHGGTEEWNREMRIDWETPNPFRPDEMGYSQWHLVVPDDINAPYREVNGKTVYRPKQMPVGVATKDMEDDDLCRFHFANCRYRPPKLTATGEEIDVPEKIYDDFFNMGQMAYVGTPLTGNVLTEEQRIHMLIPREVQTAMTTAVTVEQKLGAWIQYEFEKDLATLTLNPHHEEEEWV